MKNLFTKIPHKMLYNSKKYRLYPEITNHCNFRCIYCPHVVFNKDETAGGNVFNREKGYMSEELWDLVLENAEKYASFIGLGFFGESLLHQSFHRYIERVPCNRSYGLILFTNWSLVTREDIETMKLFDFIIISFDASYAALWEQLCPGGAVLDLNGKATKNRYDTLTEKIDYWLNLEGHSRTQLCCVVSSINEHDTKDLVNKWLPRLGRHDEIMTKTIISYGGIMKDKHMSKNQCNIPSNRCFQVAWNGDCTPCNLDVNISWNVGNLLLAKDMKRIINGEDWRQAILKIRRREGICANCFDGNNRSEDTHYCNQKITSQNKFKQLDI